MELRVEVLLRLRRREDTRVVAPEQGAEAADLQFRSSGREEGVRPAQGKRRDRGQRALRDGWGLDRHPCRSRRQLG